MEIVECLLDAKKKKHTLWGHFHSAPWPPSFFTSYSESNGKTPVAGQGLVVFTIDCRTIEHARSLLKGLRTHLLKLYGTAGRAEVNLSVFIHTGERQDWSTA